MSTGRLVVCLLLCLFVAAPGRGQDVYQDSTNHWTLRIPAGWEAASAPEVQALNAETDRAMPDRRFRYTALFRQSAPADPEPPYILVQFTPVALRGATLEDVARLFGADASQALSNAAQRISESGAAQAEFSAPAFDPATRTATLDARVARPDGAQQRVRSVMHMTYDGIVQFNLYSPLEQFSANLAQFDLFLQSFRIDPAHQWVPATSSRSSGLARMISFTITGAILGAVLGILLKRRAAQRCTPK